MGESPPAQARGARKGQGKAPEGESTIRASAAALLVPVLVLVSRCASGPPSARHFGPADPGFATSALEAWEKAVRRADSMPPSRLLYDAKFRKGSATAPGTLAVFVGPRSLTAKATGPFGGEMGRYENGTFTGKSGEAYLLDPELLRSVLAGVWRGGRPAIAGGDGVDALLRWETADGVAEAVLDVAGARLTSLSVRGRAGALRADFAGACDPWPESVSLWDLKSSRSLKLRRLAAEPILE